MNEPAATAARFHEMGGTRPGERWEDRPYALCVDLDGTLLKSDSLFESLLSMLRRTPWRILLLPFWLAAGKARLKREVFLRGPVDVETLPYDDRIVGILRSNKDRIRVLCTAADKRLAESVASHLGCFDEVLASDGRTNLKGKAKAEALAGRFSVGGFDYAGNASCDLHAWSRAVGAIVVGSNSLARRAAQKTTLLAHLPPTQRAGLLTWARAARVHQWLKNVLVVVPLFTSHRFFELGPALNAVLAFAAFCVCASGVYIINDLLDLDSDRQHPRKRLRPFAAGELPLVAGLIAGPALVATSVALAIACGNGFALALACYLVLTMAYSFRLKRVVMMDVVILAALYTTRIIGGTFAIGSQLSFWLLAFSMFVFLSLALLKRHTELVVISSSGREATRGRGYQSDDLPLVQALGAASGYIAVLVFALYIDSAESLALYRHPRLLWLLCPMLLYWISRMWLVSHRRAMHDDPVVFAASDRSSLAVIAACLAVVLAAI